MYILKFLLSSLIVPFKSMFLLKLSCPLRKWLLFRWNQSCFPFHSSGPEGKWTSSLLFIDSFQTQQPLPSANTLPIGCLCYQVMSPMPPIYWFTPESLVKFSVHSKLSLSFICLRMSIMVIFFSLLYYYSLASTFPHFLKCKTDFCNPY